MEEEFVQNQERLKPQEEKNEEERTRVGHQDSFTVHEAVCVLRLNTISMARDETLTSAFHQVEDLRGSPMSVGSLEEIIDEK